MTQGLRISKDLWIPLDAVTQTFGVVAARGSGKSYLAAVLAEELVGAGLPVCILDPLGVFWGLRSSADGKSAGLPVVIVGGDHGDVPLEATAGKVIADWVVGERRPCVLDLSLFRKGEQRQFVTDFAEHLYRANREPLHVVLDEADLFAPQRPMPGEQRMLGAIEDLVRRGRARGLGLTIITQRPAVVAKDVLTQVSVLVALRMLGPQDRDAVDAWIKFHGTGEERKKVLSSLASLPIGRAWFWSPGWLGILKQVQVRKRTTFDSSSTPGVGMKRVRPETLAPVDLDALTSKIAATIEKVKAEDPKALRKRITELDRELAAAKSARADVVPQIVRVEVPVVDANGIAQLEQMVELTRAHHETCKALLEQARAVAARPVPNLPKTAPAAVRVVPKVAAPAAARRNLNGGAGEKMLSGERRILTVLAQHGGRATKRKVALVAGYAVSGGGFGNYLSALKTRGLIERLGEDLAITDAGLSALGPYEELPTGAALLHHWCRNLGKAERLVLEKLADQHPRALSKEELGALTGYEPSGGGFGNALSRLRTLELIHGRSELQLSDELSA